MRGVKCAINISRHYSGDKALMPTRRHERAEHLIRMPSSSPEHTRLMGEYTFLSTVLHNLPQPPKPLTARLGLRAISRRLGEVAQVNAL